MAEQTHDQPPSEVPHPDEHLRAISNMLVNELGHQAMAEAELVRITSPLIPHNASRQIERELLAYGIPIAHPESVVSEAEHVAEANDAVAGIDAEYADLMRQQQQREDLLAQAYSTQGQNMHKFKYPSGNPH